jgi:hypothetical protein
VFIIVWQIEDRIAVSVLPNLVIASQQKPTFVISLLEQITIGSKSVVNISIVAGQAQAPADVR